MLIDTSGSMRGDKIDDARTALDRFVYELLDEQDELFLYRFSDRPVLVQDWTTDRFTGTLRTHLSEVGPDSDWGFGLGLGAALRLWRTEQGTARQRDLLPQLWLDLPGFASKAGLDRWSVGPAIQAGHRLGKRVGIGGGLAELRREFVGAVGHVDARIFRRV